MALSPYTKPTTPYKPNGIAHYVAKSNRPTVKSSWAVWVDSYHTAVRNNTALPSAFDYAGLYTNGAP